MFAITQMLENLLAKHVHCTIHHGVVFTLSLILCVSLWKLHSCFTYCFTIGKVIGIYYLNNDLQLQAPLCAQVSSTY